ncbi:MAG: shikimate kinase [Cytophagales bacterium]|nr:shikimate kinase [Cytophagales bacterium]MDW8383693.1 shikimate kinase [Flammeovirgaceae bacterium]
MNDIRFPNRIYLIGMPASGKTSLGKAVASLLNYSFFDLDNIIEEQEGISVQQIFAQKGEEYFRWKEREVLHATLPNRAIIACGGGTPCFFDNMAFIKQNGISFFLDETVENLLENLKEQQGKRPLLNGLSTEELKQTLRTKLQQRLPYYLMADYRLTSDEIEPERFRQKLVSLSGAFS